MTEFEHEQLADQFRSLLEQQQEVEKNYASLLDSVTDGGVLDKLRQIHRDKQRHIQMTQRLLEIIE